MENDDFEQAPPWEKEQNAVSKYKSPLSSVKELLTHAKSCFLPS